MGLILAIKKIRTIMWKLISSNLTKKRKVINAGKLTESATISEVVSAIDNQA